MTSAQKNGLKYAALIVGAATTVAFSAGWVRREIDGKEDREAHAEDVRRLADALREESTTRAMQQLRDSAQMSVVLSRVTDLWCQQNPTRSDCR